MHNWNRLIEVYANSMTHVHVVQKVFGGYIQNESGHAHGAATSCPTRSEYTPYSLDFKKPQPTV